MPGLKTSGSISQKALYKLEPGKTKVRFHFVGYGDILGLSAELEKHTGIFLSL